MRTAHGNVERHARAQLGGDAGIEAENAALAPIGRKRNADAVAGALLEIFGVAGAIDHRLAGQMRCCAGLPDWIASIAACKPS